MDLRIPLMSHLRFAVVSVCFSAVLAAQTAPCLHQNDATNSATSAFFGMTTNPGLWGWQITPGAVTTAESIRIWTSHNYTSQTGEFAELEIWDNVNAQPGQRLCGGVWRLRTAAQWQGCNFDSPVTLLPTQSYWIVFTEPGWTNLPVQSNGVSMPMMRLANATTNTWQPTFAPEALKYRIFCNKLDDQSVAPFGAACPSSSGGLGTVFVNSPPTVGNSSFKFEGSGFIPGSVAFGVLGTSSVWPSIPLPGAPSCFINTNIDVTLGIVTGVGNVRSASPDGHAEVSVAIPSNPVLIGYFLSCQIAAFDLGIGTSLPLITSNALRVTIY